jgi:hypothetical protein
LAAAIGDQQLLDLVKARTSLECGLACPKLHSPLRLGAWLERLPAGESTPASIEAPTHHRELEYSREVVE